MTSLWCDLFAYRHPRKYECLHRRETLYDCLTNKWGLHDKEVTIFGFQCKDVYTFDIDPWEEGEAITKAKAQELFLMLCGATGIKRGDLSCVVTGRGIQAIALKSRVQNYDECLLAIDVAFNGTSWYADKCFLNPYYLLTRLPNTYDRKPRKKPFLAYTLHISEDHRG